MKIIVMRHGQTDYNAKAMHMGRIFDVPINDTGRQQIEERIPEIEALAPQVIISSPLLRAAQSAEIISKHLGMPVELDDRIMEIDMGSFSGHSHKDAAAMMGVSLEEFKKRYREGTYDYTQYKGESATQVLERAKGFLESLRGRAEQCVLVVCHGGMLRALHHAATGKLYDTTKGVPNAQIDILNYE